MCPELNVVTANNNDCKNLLTCIRDNNMNQLKLSKAVDSTAAAPTTTASPVISFNSIQYCSSSGNSGNGGGNNSNNCSSSSNASVTDNSSNNGNNNSNNSMTTSNMERQILQQPQQQASRSNVYRVDENIAPCTSSSIMQTNFPTSSDIDIGGTIDRSNVLGLGESQQPEDTDTLWRLNTIKTSPSRKSTLTALDRSIDLNINKTVVEQQQQQQPDFQMEDLSC
uniref:Serine/threonine-protein kinase DDB_G0282963 n=1 Tax=Syphacia muris TaxID=451379 RepID=A0A0N5ALG0_9BILA